MKISIQSFVMESGERYCLLLEVGSGLPLFYPNLFITTQVRNASLSFASMESALSSISVLLKFCDERQIDLVERLRAGTFFQLNEVDALADYCQFNLSSKVAANKVTSLVKVRRPRVASETVYRRLSVIAKYIEWLAAVLNVGGSTDQKKLVGLVKKIRSRRPVKKGRNQSLVEKGLTDEQVELLFEVFRPESDLNPFEGESTKVRNRLMFLMLHYLGIRMGELLSIKVKDVDFSNNQIVIARRADEKSDPRVDQPLVKTMDRRIPLKESLAAEIHNYVMNYRRNEVSARKHEYLFVVHKPGPTSGQPVSKATYNKVMTTVKALSPKLIDFTGHALRHKWNERFSQLMDSMDESPDEAQQEQLRSWLMGWKQGSGTAAHYNQRYIKNKANEAFLKLQTGIEK
ncbi:tyrosine-type recombinase/integrase [Thiomicrospira microaerophila]|uniref:tyrosine-type recombinase/integrase n=1 Tax=Thiomicrospira microaerophila TaxID=406020 RepID=UPI0018E0827E|nr:site-specific integrase [Thiomicrospira microaerophila]